MGKMTFSEALELLKKGKKVSSKRWGGEGKVFVHLLKFKINDDNEVKSLVLHDSNRNKTVGFVPSVENMFDDEWYEVK